MTAREQFVYWLFDEQDGCLYVGMTRQPKKRWAAHRKRFGPEVAYKRMAGPYTEQTARRIEREQQDELLPKYDGHLRRRRRQSSGIYTVARAAQLFGVPYEVLQKVVHPYEFIRIPDDEGAAA